MEDQSFIANVDATLAERERVLGAELKRIRDARAALKGGENVAAVEPLQLTPKTKTASQTQSAVLQFRPVPKTIVEAAREVLTKANKPLHIRKIVLGIQALGLGQDQQFPALRASVTPALLRRNDLFRRYGKGVYGLNEADDVQAVGLGM